MNARLAVVTISDIATQVRGVSYDKAEASSEPANGKVALLRANNIVDDDLTFDDLVYVPEGRVSGKQRLQQHDVVIAASSGSLTAVGKAGALLSEDFDGTFGAFCKVLRPDLSRVDAMYFAHFFKTAEYRRKVSSLAAGANINNLKNEHLDNLVFPLPPLDEQRRIAAILDRADALRQKRKRAIALLDSLTQSVFLEMFGGEQRWPEAPLADVVKPSTIVTYGIVQAGEEYDGGIPYIRTGDIQGGKIVVHGLRRTDPAIAAKFERSRVRTDEIVMSIRATVGTVALVPPEIDGANLTQGTARISPGPNTNGLYLLHYLRSADVQAWIKRQVKGATFLEITLGKLRELMVTLPPLELQNEFASRISATTRASTLAGGNQANLDALFASLQHRAFSGQL